MNKFDKKNVLICENCKSFWIAPMDRCDCGSTTLSKTHENNYKLARNFICNMENKKEYLVTLNLKLSGVLPDTISEDHIKNNLIHKIQSECSDITLSGEYYGDYDDQWLVCVDGDIDAEITEYKINYSENPFCEHCGDNYTDFGVEINVGGTSWCLDCFSNNETLSENEYENILLLEKNKRKKYLQNKVKKLNKEIKDLDEN